MSEDDDDGAMLNVFADGRAGVSQGRAELHSQGEAPELCHKKDWGQGIKRKGLQALNTKLGVYSAGLHFVLSCFHTSVQCISLVIQSLEKLIYSSRLTQ